MPDKAGSCLEELERLEGIESDIGDAIDRAADELARDEYFETEQRAEIYAILRSLRDNTRDHRKIIRRLAEKLSEGGGE
jgi:hypothetical protein